MVFQIEIYNIAFGPSLVFLVKVNFLLLYLFESPFDEKSGKCSSGSTISGTAVPGRREYTRLNCSMSGFCDSLS